MVNESSSPGAGCVVLADSHQNMLEGTRGLLETAFSAVVMVANKASMFQAIDRMDPEILVVDLSLPMPEGDSVIQDLRKRYPDLKFIVLSLYDDPIAMERVMTDGASGYVLKRAIATDLLNAIDEIRLGHTFVSPLPK
jgi:DNA-binding NarL/FixJ family response regulator